MTALIDALPFTVLKGLSKRYLKLLRARDTNSPATLMALQDDLARAAGHRDAHAAQSYWQRKTAAPAEPVTLSADASPPAGSIDVNTESLGDPWGALLQRAAVAMAFFYGTVNTHQLVRQALSLSGAPAAPQDRRQAAEQLRRRLAEGVVGLVAQGDCWTTSDWLEGQRRLAKRSVMQDECLIVRPPPPTEDQERDGAVAKACGPGVLTVVCAETGSDRDAFAKSVAECHWRAGWGVCGSAASWKATARLQEALGLETNQTILSLLKENASHWSSRMLVIVDDADRASAQAAVDLLDLVSTSAAQVKVLALGSEGSDFHHTALEALSRNVPVQRLGASARPSLAKPSAVPAQEDERSSSLADGFVLSSGQRAAREVDPAVIGRAFLQVLNDPGKQWRDLPCQEFSVAVARRAAELDHVVPPPSQRPLKRAPGRSG